MAGGRAETRTTKAISKSGGSENALRGVGWGWWRRREVDIAESKSLQGHSPLTAGRRCQGSKRLHSQHEWCTKSQGGRKVWHDARAQVPVEQEGMGCVLRIAYCSQTF